MAQVSQTHTFCNLAFRPLDKTDRLLQTLLPLSDPTLKYWVAKVFSLCGLTKIKVSKPPSCFSIMSTACPCCRLLQRPIWCCRS